MRNIKTHKIFHHFWNKEIGLTYMLILVCLSDFVIMPFLIDQLLLKMLMVIFWTLMLITGLETLIKSGLRLYALSVIPLLYFAVNIIPFFMIFDNLLFIRFVIDITALCLIIGLVLVKVFENGNVTIHRIIGAVAAYMFIGNLWAVLFRFVYEQVPGSFILPASEHSGIASTGAFLYFSFETLTTTGFGEFLPVHPIARTLTIMEQLIGVMYPIILIGRLVSLRIETKE